MPSKKMLTSPALNSEFSSCLRLVEPSDAQFICSLRADPVLNKHISASSDDLAQQIEWIERYKKRESNGEEYYFIINNNGTDYGAIRMYDFLETPLSFSWGSWIIKPTRPSGLVTFSALMIYEIGFDALGFDQAHFDVRKENTNVINFHLRSGAIETGETDIDRLFAFPKEAWPTFRSKSADQISQHRAPRK